MGRGVSPTPEAITINDVGKSLTVDYAILFKTLKDLLNNKIEPAVDIQFTALQNIVTQRMEPIMDQRM